MNISNTHLKLKKCLTYVTNSYFSTWMYFTEYFNVFEYLVWTSHETKNVGETLAKPAPKKGKTITIETLHLITNAFEDDNFSRKVPEKKDYVSVSKGVHKQKLFKFQKSL